jgi:hypothetical protein
VPAVTTRRERAMNILIAVFAGMAIGGCITAAPKGGFLPPRSVYRQIGAVVVSPNEPGWSLAQSGGYGTAFIRRYGAAGGAAGETAVADTLLFKADGFKKDEDFLAFFEKQRAKQDDNRKFRVVSITNRRVKFKDTACLKYEGLFEDRVDELGSAPSGFVKTLGYICRHPAKKNAAFQMELSHRSEERELPPALLSTGEQFFEAVRFNNEGF